MPNKIVHKKSGTTGLVPAPGELDHAELAVNYADSDLYLKNLAGDAVVKVTHASNIKTTAAGNLAATNVQAALNELDSEKLAIPASSAQGDILYHDGSSWTRLAAGTSGHYLKTQGASANPTWAAVSSSAGLVLLATATASNVTSVDFTSGIDSTYDEYEIHLLNVLPATDNVSLHLRTSANSGSSYDSGASDYYWRFFEVVATGVNFNTGDSFIRIAETVGNAANEFGVSGIIRLVRPYVSKIQEIVSSLSWLDTVSVPYISVGHHRRLSAAPVNGIRFFFSSGNIASGEFKLYGLKKSL